MNVIARCAKRAVAIQLDYFIVPQSGTPHNDRIPNQLLTRMKAKEIGAADQLLCLR
jgi:hypothetical protein